MSARTTRSVLGRYTIFKDDFPSSLLQDSILSVQNNIQKKPGLMNVTISHKNEETNSQDTLHLSLWKPLLSSLHIKNSVNKRLLEAAPEPLTSLTRSNKDYPLVAVLVCHGGQFSGCIFRCESFNKPLQQRSKLDKHQIAIPVLRKTFHKYTTRKKQGKRQMTHDSVTGHSAQSIGSQIRRDQEKLFQLQLAELLQVTWKETLEKCALVCLYCPGQFNFQSVIELLPEPTRDRVTTIPFTISKPNYSHVILAFKKLMTVHVRDRIHATDNDDEDLDSDDQDSSEESGDDNLIADYELNEKEQQQQNIRQRKRNNSYQKKNTNRDWTSEPVTPQSALSPAQSSSLSTLSESVFDLPEESVKAVPIPAKKIKKQPIKKPNVFVQLLDKIGSYKITLVCLVALAVLLYFILSEDYTKERREAGLNDDD
jgi:hypothetical protein